MFCTVSAWNSEKVHKCHHCSGTTGWTLKGQIKSLGEHTDYIFSSSDLSIETKANTGEIKLQKFITKNVEMI